MSWKYSAVVQKSVKSFFSRRSLSDRLFKMSTSDWVDLSAEQISFVATLSQAYGPSLFESDPETSSDKVNSRDEFLLTLEADVGFEALPWIKKVKNEEVEFVIILDMSGSMAGTPWSQVQSAAIKMLEMVKKSKKISVTMMVYNHEARFIQLNSNLNVASLEIRQLRAEGSTNFVDVFEKLGKRIHDRVVATEKPEKDRTAEERHRANEKKKMFVIFMTDGHDTCNNPTSIMASKEKLQDLMGKYGEEVVVHVLGFGEHHNDAFLRQLSLLGTSDGSYCFVNPRDDVKGLEKTLTDLMKATTGLVGKSVFLVLKMKNEARFIGDWFGQEDEEIVLQAFLQVDDKKNIARIVTTKFVRIPSHLTLNLEIELVRDLLARSETTPTPCNIKCIQFGRERDTKVTLRKLRAGLNMLTARLGDSVEDSSTSSIVDEVSKWHAIIKKYLEVAKEEKLATGTDDKEVRDLCDAIQSGLVICERALRREAGESEDVYTKRVRATHTTYNLYSGQMYNTKSSVPSQASRKRTSLQRNQKMMD